MIVNGTVCAQLSRCRLIPLLHFYHDLSARSMHLLLQATWASVCNLRDSGCQMEGRERRHMAVNSGGSSGTGGRCSGSKNDRAIVEV